MASASAEPCTDVIKLSITEEDNNEEKGINRRILQRAQWLRAAILGANDGLLSTTSLMLGVGAAQEDQWLMIVSGLAGSLAGACSMAVGEFVSVSTQRDIEKTILNNDRHGKKLGGEINDELSKTSTLSGSREAAVDDGGDIIDEEALPNPYKAGIASGLSFLCGSMIPLATAMVFRRYEIRVLAVVVMASLAMAAFGGVGARVGGSRVTVSAVRVLVGGWIAMGVTYGLLMPLHDHDKDSNESA